MEKIKILCVINSLDKCNGISSYIMNYYYNINHDKFKYDFLITDDNICEEYRKEIEKNGDRIILSRRIKLKNCLAVMKELKNIITLENYDIVYSHILYTAFFYFWIAKKAKIKHRILHSHNAVSRNKNILKQVLISIMSWLAVAMATDYFACSKHAGEYQFGKSDFKIIRNAINVEQYLFDKNTRTEYREQMKLEDKLVLTNVGRLSMQKNQIFLLCLIEKLVEKNKNIKLLLIGNGEDENKLKEYVKLNKLENYVEFLGVRDDIGNLLQATDIFVFPSLFEGLGIAAIEAQMSGLPCLISNKVPKEVMINDNVEFLGIAQDNIDDWCEGILKYKDAKRVCDREKLEHSGYNIKNEAHKLEDLFTEMI